MYNLIGQAVVGASELYGSCLGSDNLRFVRLGEEPEYEQLQQLFENADGIRLPLSYLKQGRAFLCKNKSGEVQGGFAFIDNGPYRSLEQIPMKMVNLSEQELTEITGVCLSSGNGLRRLRFWSFMIGQALSSPSNEFIYAVDSTKLSLREKIFNHIRLETLYEGVVKQLEGMSETSTEAVELTTKAQLFTGFGKLAYREGMVLFNETVAQRKQLLSSTFKKPMRLVKKLSFQLR